MSVELFVPPSQFVTGSGATAGRWQRGIPRAGITAFTPASPAIPGLADCNNLLANSPPTILEAYEIFSYSIGWGAYIAQGAAYTVPPVFVAELALLVNGRVRYVTSQQVESVLSTAALEATASGSWIGDLVNPIRVGARDRLSLRMGVLTDQSGLANFVGIVGAQLQNTPTGTPTLTGFESTISYRTIDLPGSRRI